MSKIAFVLSSKDKEKAVFEGYVYTKDKEIERKSYWRCEQRMCNSRMHSNGDVIVRKPTEHRLHAPSFDRVCAAFVIGEVRRKAIECESTTKNILQQAMSKVPTAVAPAMSSTSALSQIIRRKRRAALAYGEVENGVDQKNIVPRKLQETCNNNAFMRCSSENMVLFASDVAMDMLFDQPNWFADETFYVSPKEYTQLYTIHVLLGNSETIPCVYAILKNKSIESYAAIFQCLHDMNPDRPLNPITITVDFEQAAITAFKEKFPEISVHGCFFHLSQNIWRRIQESGLQIKYCSDAEFALKSRCIAAIAFLPTEDIIRGFEILVYGEDYPDKLDPVVDYFESNYIGSISRGRKRKRPNFQHSMWSQYQRVKNDLPRTTNSIEGWHNALKGVIQKAHPSMAALATKLRLEESNVAKKIERVKAGYPTKCKRKKYEAVDTRIKLLVDGYDSNNIMQYLRSIAQNIAF